MLIMVGVETQQNIVFVKTVQISKYYGIGKIQRVNRDGGTTANVEADSPYQTVHQLNVILMGKPRAVIGR